MEATTLPESYIPEDAVAEILVRLPVKSLIRCLIVCKSWNSLIRNPSFITAHLNLNLSKAEDPCFLNVYRHSGVLLSENTLTMRAKFELPYLLAETDIIGSCNGLLSIRIRYGAGEGIFLYNPSIEHFKVVEISRGSETDVLYGFGYHEQSKDHRLVKLQDFPENKVGVYSLRTASWQELQQSPPRKLLSHCRSTTGLYFNGATHWWTSIEVEHDLYFLYSIVAFDFREEVFREIILPSELQVDMDEFVHINEFQGSLALVVSNRLHDNQDYTTCALWVMSEYGVSESWNKKFQVSFSDIYKQPVGFTKNGSVILLRNGNSDSRSKSLVLYRLQDHQYEDSEHIIFVKDVFDFTESLLLLDHKNSLWRYQPFDSDDLYYWDSRVLLECISYSLES